jgi:hypothetical protein
MNASLWHKELLLAANGEDVLSTIRDYLVLWRPDELAQLPVPCDPERFADVRDVTEYAAALLSHPGPARKTAAAEALTAFFTVAARRVAELSAGQAAPVRVTETAGV